VGTQALRQPLSSDGPTKKTIVSLLGHPPAKHRKKNDLIVRGSSRREPNTSLAGGAFLDQRDSTCTFQIAIVLGDNL